MKNRNLFGKSPKYSDLKSHELEMQGKKKDLQKGYMCLVRSIAQPTSF